MKTSKRLLALVLALALVFTGLSGTFSAFAATAYTANTTVDSQLYHVGLQGASVTDANYTNYRYLAQQFVPSATNLSGAKLALNLTTGSATVHLELRSSVNGSALASNDYRIASKGSGVNWYDVSFGKNVTVTAGSVYYLVFWLTERTASATCLVAGTQVSKPANPGYVWQMSTGGTPTFTSGNYIYGFQLITETYTAPIFEAWTQIDTAFTHLGLEGATVTDGNFNNYRYIAQEFATNLSSLTGASVALNLTTGTATVHVEIRSAVNGSAIASNDVTISSQGNAFAWYDLPFNSAVSVTPGQRYYLVYWLKARTSGASCVVPGSDAGSNNAFPCYLWKMTTSGTVNFTVDSHVVPFRLTGSGSGGTTVPNAYTEFTEDGTAFTHLGLSTATSSDGNWGNYRYIAQEFVAGSNSISGASVALNLTAGTATVHVEIRSSVNGSAIASNNVNITSQGNGRYWYDLPFASNVAVTAGNTYYLVYYLTARTSSSVCVVYGADKGANNAAHPCYLWKMADGGSVNFTAGNKNLIACFRILAASSGGGTSTGGGSLTAFTSSTQTGSAITHLGLSTATSADGNWGNYRYIAQEFVPASADLWGAKVALNLTTGNATVHMEIRSAVNGTPLASSDVTITSKGNGVNWYDLPLKSKLTVITGQAYYLVYYLTARDSGSVCIAHGADVGAGKAEHPGYVWKMADGGNVTFSVGNKNLVFGFQIATAKMTSADQDAAQAVIDKIAALPATITSAHKSAVTSARSAYNALTTTQRALVTNLSKLTAAEAVIANYDAAAAVDAKISALPAASSLTLSNKSAVTAARTAYKNLTSAQQKLVTKLSTLEAAETKIANLEAAQAVIDKIAALPSTITLSNKSAVTAARTAYKALTSAQQALVTNLSKLTAAEATIANLEKEAANKAAAQTVIDKIAALPATSSLTLSNKSAVTAARSAYNGLTDAQKAYVTNLSTLTAAEKKIAELEVAEANKAAAQPVVDLIAALPSNITLSNENDVTAARNAYTGLTDAQKAFVTNLSKLTTAESKIAQLKKEKADKEAAQGVIDVIASLPAKITLAHEIIVKAVRASYDDLTDAQKAYVTNYSTLQAAEKAIEDLKSGASDKEIAKAVVDQIAALPANITLSHKDAVSAARTAYNKLTTAQRNYVTNLSKLTAAEAAIANLEKEEADKAVARTVIEKIADLPATVTLANKKAVADARTAYNGLTDVQKDYVTNLPKLVNAEKAIADLEKIELDKAAAKAVDDKIAALPQNVTKENADAIAEARAAYSALTDDQKGYVTNLSKLVAAEKALADADTAVADKAAADAVIAQIDALTGEDKQAVRAARDAYNALTAAQKELVTNLSKLTGFETGNELVIPEPPAEVTVECGDVDGDGAITANDALDILKSIVGKVTLDEEQKIAANCSGDDKIAADDALLVLQYVVGKIIAFPAEGNVGEINQQAADAVIAKIDAIPADFGLDYEATILEIVDAYAALTASQRELVTNFGALQAAWDRVEDLKVAQFVVNRIDALSDSVTLEEKPAVIAAGNAYDALTDAQKALVTNHEKLVAALEAIPALEQEAADKAVAQVIVEQINALSDPITLEEKSAVEAARAAFNGLTDAQKAFVTNLEKLTAAEELIPQLEKVAADKAVAQGVVDLIALLPNPVTLNDQDDVDAVRKAYEGLTDAQKEYVTNYDVLVEAERVIADSQATDGDREAAQFVIEAIDALPSNITLTTKAIVVATRDMYEALTDLQKDLVTNLATLTAAEKKIADLEAVEADKEAAKAVDDIIASLPASITLANKSTVQMARKVYESLTKTQKGYVTKLATLEAAEKAIADLDKAEADKAAAKVVQDMIAALPATITLSNKSAVTDARKAYKDLTSAQQKLVTNLDKLTAAETTIANLEKVEADKAAAKVVQDQIAALPSTITLSHESAVTAARAAYKALTSAQQAYVTNLTKLTNAEKTIANLKQQQTDKAAAAAVDSKIAAIGTLTASNYQSKKSAITAARSAYNALTDTQKGYVTKLSVLTAAEKTWDELNAAASQPKDPANPVISEGYQTVPQLQNVSGYATPVSPVKNNLSFNTLTQINQSYSKLYDLDVDCILAYEYGMPDDTTGGLASSWVQNKHTYNDNTTVGLMIAVNRDNAEYLEKYAGSRGVADIQTKADGSLRSHSVLNNKTIYYMVPTNAYLDYKWQVIDKYLQSGKIKVVALEEPELWNECGYSAGYKELYKQYYGTNWVDPTSSADAMWKNQQCKAWAFKNAFEVLSGKIKAKYPDVKVLVTTHGPLSYMHHGVSTGASMYANIPTIDGVIGQTWSDDASQPFMFGGNRVGNVFMNAMYAYNSYGELMSDGKALYLLQDPASDNGAIDKETLEENWKQTVVAAMMQNDTTSFQSTIWPQRAFTAMGMDYKTVQLSVNKMYQEFSNSDMYGANYAATPGVAMAVSDSMGWHLGSNNVINGHSKDTFSGIYMSLQNDGVPVDTVNLDTLSTTAQLKDVKVLIITYDALKPLTEQANAAIATWVKAGGRLLMLNGRDGFDSLSSQWWGQKGKTPYKDMFDKLGLSISYASNVSGTPTWSGVTCDAIPSSYPAYTLSFTGSGFTTFMKVGSKNVGIEATVGSGKAVIVGLPSAYYSRSSNGTNMVRRLVEKALAGSSTTYKSGVSFVSVRGNYFAYYSPTQASKTANNRTFINLLHPNLEVVPGGTGIPRQEAVLYYDITNQDNDDIPRFCFTGGTETAARYQDANKTRFTITNPSNSVAATLLLGNGKYPQSVTAKAKSGKEVAFITNWDDYNGALIIKANNPDVNDPITFEVIWGNSYVSLPTNYVYDSFNHFTKDDTKGDDPLLYSSTGYASDGTYFCDNNTEYIWRIDLNTYKQASLTLDIFGNYTVSVSFNGSSWTTVADYSKEGKGPVGNLADGSYVPGASNRTDVTVNANDYDASATSRYMYVRLGSCYMNTAQHPAGDHGGSTYSYALTYLTPA